MSSPVTISADTTYYPGWLQAQGVDVDALTKQLAEIKTADRRAAHMKYRGHELKRSKWFLVDSLEKVPIYSYPSFQYESVVAEYKTIASNPLIAGLHELITRNFDVVTNHIIGTTYRDQTDNIGFHNDKVATLDETASIFALSFGQQRPLSLRPNPTETDKDPAVACEVPMEPGSLFVLGPRTNEHYQHAILPSSGALGLRISVIFRCVKNLVPMSVIQKKVLAAQKKRSVA